MNQLQVNLQHALSLTPTESAIATVYFQEKSYSKGTLLQDINGPCNKLYFIKQGYIRFYNIIEGKEITQWISTPGYFATNLSAWIFNYPNRWYVEALSDLIVFEITKDNYQIMQQQIDNWYDKERFFIGHCFLQMESRINNFLSLNSEQRYTIFCEDYRYLFNEVPHHYIASLLGITSETLSRIRKKQAKE